MFTAICLGASARPIELTPIQETIRYSTAAVGGFASASFSVKGDRRRDLPWLAEIVILYGTEVVWEGRIEDLGLMISAGDLSTSVGCFGFQRLFDDVSVRRIWSKRDLPWLDSPIPHDTTGGSSHTHDTKGYDVRIGQYDITQPTRRGVKIAGKGVLVAAGREGSAIYNLPSGVTLERVMGTVAIGGIVTFTSTLSPAIEFYNDATYGVGAYLTTAAINLTPSASTHKQGLRVMLINNTGGGVTPTGTDYAEFYDLRILGTSLTEDASGGFYGGTLLRDLLALVPGLTTGIIEDGSDFTIQALERAVRNSARSVLDEVAGYYRREWAVWEDRKFDWRTASYDVANYPLRLADVLDLNLSATVEGLAKTQYVLYRDAASGRDEEASATSTNQSNSFVKTGATRDAIRSTGFPMTSNTAAQLASRITQDESGYPSVRGRVTLPADLTLNGIARRPAIFIRGGENVVFPELPKTEMLRPGRDGETLFHVAATEVDMAARTVTLELEGQARSIDVLLARLAAVTRTLTG